MFQRRAYIREDKRGQPSREASELNECLFDGVVPDKHVAIMTAFPADGEAAFRAAARRKGIIPLIVSVPRFPQDTATTDKAQVRPPDAVETITMNYREMRPHSLVAPRRTTREGTSEGLYAEER